ARRAARVVDERIARHAGDRRNAVAFRPDVAPPKLAVDVKRRPRRLPLRDERGSCDDCRADDDEESAHEASEITHHVSPITGARGFSRAAARLKARAPSESK